MKSRPTGVTVLAVLALIGAVLALFATASGSLGAWAFGAGLTVAVLYGFYSLALAVLYLVLAYGMWTLKRWAWMFGIIAMALTALGYLYGLVTGNAGALIGLVLACAVLWYLFQPGIKQAFGRG